MGQCIAAFERYKDRRLDRIIGHMSTAAETKTEMYRKQAEEQAGKVRKTESQIDAVKSRIKGRQPTPYERKLMLDLLKQKKSQIKRKDMFTSMSMGAENEQFNVQNFATGKEVVKQNKILVKGFKELRSEGYNVNVVDSSLDKVEDANDEMTEINQALQSRLEINPSEDEMQDLDREIDAMFAPTEKETARSVLKMQTSKYTPLQEPIELDEIEPVAQVLIDSEN